MTPIIDGLRRLSEGTVDMEGHDSEHETIKTTSRHYSTDTASTDTFQTNDSREYIDRARKTSKTESSDLSSLRNLSTNGLMMFDPLVINAVSASTSDSNRQIPDHDLVTSLNEQVTEIADRLSSIAASDVDLLEHQLHSFSTNDVPTLISADDPEAYGFSGPRNEQLSCLPSTSHGYLIPNAISHDPAVLSSLSHNNSAVFNQEDDAGSDINSAMLNSDLPLIIPENIDADIVNTNISIANANLSSLLLTNEEYNHLEEETADGDNTSFHSAKMTLDREDERVKFMLGYESEHESPADSGVSTENTSLDRSPDTDQSKDIKDIRDNHFMQQNRVLKSPDAETDDDKHTKNTLESSFSDVNNDVTVNINYVEDDSNKNEAGSSSVMDKVINRLSSDEEGLNEATNVSEARRVLQDWGANAGDEEYRTIDEVITELRRHREADKKISSLVEEDNNVSSNADVGPSQSRPKKIRKSNTKSKKKKSKIWSPGMVILDNRSTQNQNSPLRLNLDHFVDER